MLVEIYFCRSLVNIESQLCKIQGQESDAVLVDTQHTVSSMYSDGWKLAHAVKTAGSAQLESFNFLLIFEKSE